MSEIGTISEELEKPSDIHMVDWWLFLPFIVLIVSAIVVGCSLNAYFTGDPSKYTQGPGTTYVPPEDPKKSK